MTRRNITVSLMLISLSVVSLAWGQGVRNVSWTVQPTKARFNQADQITLAYELKNLSSSQILAASSPQISGEMQLELIGPDGGKVAWHGAVASAGPSFEFTLLGPNRALSGTVLIPTSCDQTSFKGGYCLHKPGRYTGVVVYHAPSYEFLKSIKCNRVFATGPYRSNRFQFDID